MLPANMFGSTRLNTFGWVTRSFCRRTSGMPFFQAVSPALRYDTATDALRLASPSITHSKPRLISVGGSTTRSPGVTRVLGGAGVWAMPAAPESTAMEMTAMRARLIMAR